MKIRRFRGETLTLATTVGFAQTRGAPPGMNGVLVETPSATLEQISLALTPRIRRVWFYDDSATTYTDLTNALTNRNTTSDSGSSLNSMTSSDFLYVGCPMRFRGIAVDVVLANIDTSTGNVDYWNGSAWTNITVTDGTAASGPTRTLNQDGLWTWTVPTDWAVTSVNGADGDLFWVRFKVTATLDTTVSIAELSTLLNTVLNSANSDAEGQDYLLLRSNNDTRDPYLFLFDPTRFGGLEAKSASITSAMNLNWIQCAY